jgi:hypothetical protein
MWKRLLEPMPYDRACRSRVNVILYLDIVWLLAVIILVGVAIKREWLELGFIGWLYFFLACCAFSAAPQRVFLCRTCAAYGISRQSNPNWLTRAGLAIGLPPPRRFTFQQLVKVNLFGPIALALMGAVVMIVVFFLL